MTRALNSARVNSLLAEALWELANESEAQRPEQADLLDSMIDAARANLMSGMMPEEAEFIGLTGRPLSTERSSIAARAAELRAIHAQVAPAARTR